MKKFFVFMLLSFRIFAQEMPISESNYFVYDKYNYGETIFNINPYMFQKTNGELYCSEYAGLIYKISNTSANKALPEIKKNNDRLWGHFKFKNDLEYFCCNQQIIVSKNEKIIQKIQLNSSNDISSNFQTFKNEIYFVTNYKNGQFLLRKFDGKKVIDLIPLKKDVDRYGYQLYITNHIYIIHYNKSSFTIFKYENEKLIFLKNYQSNFDIISIQRITDENNFSGFLGKSNFFNCVKGKIQYFKFSNLVFNSTDNITHSLKFEDNTIIYKMTNQGLNPLFNTTFNSSHFFNVYNQESNSYYTATSSNLIRFFPLIKKYPRLFNNTNSTNIFSLTQDDKGKIWTGSYHAALSTIDNEKVVQSKIKDIMFMNGGLSIKDKIILFGEGCKGALLFSDVNHYKKIADSIIVFYGYISNNKKLYLGTFNKGLWFTDINNLYKKTPVIWSKINDKQRLNLFNIITIAEDKFGNIWMGRSSQGMAVYNPKTNKAKTWLIDKKEIDFGSMASVLDNKETLWFGKNDGGLCFYDGKNENDYNVKNFKSINHPLLKNERGITFIKQWKDYLILGAKDRILLFDLNKWYLNRTISVRYLNSQETNFTSPTEQNTCLIDNRDESVWFATSDMLYQWNIKKWLLLSTFKVIPSILIKKGSTETAYFPQKCIEFQPTENSFDLEINYQTKDNLPRFVNGILVKKGENPIFENPNLQTKFHFANLTAGDYIFYSRVCQQDGSFDIFEYPISIDSFLWQKWWFWALIGLLKIGIIIYFFQKRNQIEKQKKKLSQLNLSSLSNQFRPHFMLNALNSIGSELEDKPHAEKVISRLGESINILYDFTQQNDFTHEIKNEWKLVENIIEIQKLLFITNLEFIFNGKELIDETTKVPVGIIQIPVENALLHGLRNKQNGNCILEIDVMETIQSYSVSIKDNGVGRQKAAQINNFKKNGNGLKTVFEMIEIINNNQPNAINFNIQDIENKLGTIVTIELQKNIDYDKIKL